MPQILICAIEPLLALIRASRRGLIFSMPYHVTISVSWVGVRRVWTFRNVNKKGLSILEHFYASYGIIYVRMQNRRKNHTSEDNGFAPWVKIKIKYLG